ncbi:MAG: hypothetical protein GF333_00405 [Candidatus Omnitrophica bacterium]|nr:hypothetical protein [Candidatus Omnitrophota bacterium]
MTRIVSDAVRSYSLDTPFLSRLAEVLIREYIREGNDLSHVACVFGGKRPALFLRRELARRIRSSFLPPRVMTIDELIELLLPAEEYSGPVDELDAAFLIYSLARERFPEIMPGTRSFGAFLPWAREIVSFIDQLDLEGIGAEALTSIEKSAVIGYEVPESINRLLQSIVGLREEYHRQLRNRKTLSRGMKYAAAARHAANRFPEDLSSVLFCNFFYLHATEKKLISACMAQKKGACFFQGRAEDWSVLRENAAVFGTSIRPAEDTPGTFPEFSVWRGFDIHSQVGLVRHIFAQERISPEETVIVVPRPEAVIPLLHELSGELAECNVSLGYPLKRSTLYVLFYSLRKVQESKKNGGYYARDYLDVLKHPLIKNLRLSDDSRATRVLVHKIEELLNGGEDSSIGGCLFFELDQIENEPKVYQATCQTLAHMDIACTEEECAVLLRALHRVCFRQWERTESFAAFCECVREVLDILVEKSPVIQYPWNRKIIERVYEVEQQLSQSLFVETSFPADELWDIFQQRLDATMISFHGSPLRGLQILGLFETRSLHFRNVIVLDMNESVFPKLRVYEPFVPREVMLSLGLNRLEKEEEIQRYQFMRLISSAERAFFIYEENDVNEKSRFIEALMWEKQKQEYTLQVTSAPQGRFRCKVPLRHSSAEKTPEIIEELRRSTYSASRINTYLHCPLQFYYQYVLGLREKEDLLQEPEPATIGTFLHELLEESFTPYAGKRPVLDERFEKEFFRRMEDKFEREVSRRMKSDALLLKKIFRFRLKKFLRNERERSEGISRIISLEKECRDHVVLDGCHLEFRYTADRIDELNEGTLLIIDYKSGGADIAPKPQRVLEKSLEMNRESIKEQIKSFQLPLYYYFLQKEYPRRRVNAELYNIRTLERKPFISADTDRQADARLNLCLGALAHIFRELFDEGVPFVADPQENRCRFCPFAHLCG